MGDAAVATSGRSDISRWKEGGARPGSTRADPNEDGVARVAATRTEARRTGESGAHRDETIRSAGHRESLRKASDRCAMLSLWPVCSRCSRCAPIDNTVGADLPSVHPPCSSSDRIASSPTSPPRAPLRAFSLLLENATPCCGPGNSAFPSKRNVPRRKEETLNAAAYTTGVHPRGSRGSRGFAVRAVVKRRDDSRLRIERSRDKLCNPNRNDAPIVTVAVVAVVSRVRSRGRDRFGSLALTNAVLRSGRFRRRVPGFWSLPAADAVCGENGRSERERGERRTVYTRSRVQR